MKKLFLAASVLALFAVSAFTFSPMEYGLRTFGRSGDDAPAAVKTKFTSLYPGATKVKWKKEDANYEAEFEMNKTEMSCLFDATGNLLETETEIAVTALPKGVSDYVTKNYPGQKIKEASKIVDAKKVTTYEAEVKEGDLIFDANGNFLKKVVEKKDAEDDEKDKKK
ncbi:MAG: PepSY-like domain-containing protein [Bacteroidia bacterium]